MSTAQLRSRRDFAADDTNNIDVATLESAEVGDSGVLAKDGSLILTLPPALPEIDLSGESREWRIPASILRAEEHFYALLAELLPQHSGKWVYVTYDGQYEVYPTADRAEIKAEDQGFSPEEFVVRMISTCELPNL